MGNWFSSDSESIVETSVGNQAQKIIINDNDQILIIIGILLCLFKIIEFVTYIYQLNTRRIKRRYVPEAPQGPQQV